MIYPFNIFNLKLPTLVSSKLITDDRMNKCGHISNGGKTNIKVSLGVCFALKSWKKYLLLFTYLIASSKDVTFPLITKFKTNRYLSYLSVNRILN